MSNVETKKIINDIKIEFLSLLDKNMIGYFISLEQVYNWLENPEVYVRYSTDDMFRRNFRRRFLRSDKVMLDEAKNESNLDDDFIMRKNKNIEYPWFSVDGFKTFCIAVDEDKSRYVRKYFIQIEKDYLRVLRQSKEENEKENKELKDKIAKLDSRLMDNIDRANKYEEQALMLEFKLKKNEAIEMILDDKDDFATEGNPEYKEYLYLKSLYYKKVPLYIVNPEYIAAKLNKINKIDKTNKTKPNKTKKSDKIENTNEAERLNIIISDSESDSNTVMTDVKSTKSAKHDPKFNYNALYDLDFNEYSIVDIENEYESHELFYYIGGLTQTAKPTDNFYKVTDLLVKDNKHLKQIKDVLNTDDLINGKYYYKTAYKSIYKASYNLIKSISLSIIQEREREMIIDNFA